MEPKKAAPMEWIGGPTFGPILHWFVCTSGLSRLILWYCFDCTVRVPGLVRIAPWLLGLAMGRKPHRVEREEAHVESGNRESGAGADPDRE